jgi:hypothetical protein
MPEQKITTSGGHLFRSARRIHAIMKLTNRMNGWKRERVCRGDITEPRWCDCILNRRACMRVAGLGGPVGNQFSEEFGSSLM